MQHVGGVSCSDVTTRMLQIRDRREDIVWNRVFRKMAETDSVMQECMVLWVQ